MGFWHTNSDSKKSEVGHDAIEDTLQRHRIRKTIPLAVTNYTG